METVAVVLVLLWLLGVITSYTVGGLLHVLPVAAVAMMVLQILRSRRAY